MESWLIAIIILLLLLVILIVVNKEDRVITQKEEKRLVKESEELQMKEKGLRIGEVIKIEFLNPIPGSNYFYTAKYTLKIRCLEYQEDSIEVSTINHKTNKVMIGSVIEYYKYNKYMYIRLTTKKGKAVKTSEEVGKVVKVIS